MLPPISAAPRVSQRMHMIHIGSADIAQPDRGEFSRNETPVTAEWLGAFAFRAAPPLSRFAEQFDVFLVIADDGVAVSDADRPGVGSWRRSRRDAYPDRRVVGYSPFDGDSRLPSGPRG